MKKIFKKHTLALSIDGSLRQRRPRNYLIATNASDVDKKNIGTKKTTDLAFFDSNPTLLQVRRWRFATYANGKLEKSVALRPESLLIRLAIDCFARARPRERPARPRGLGTERRRKTNPKRQRERQNPKKEQKKDQRTKRTDVGKGKWENPVNSGEAVTTTGPADQ